MWKDDCTMCTLVHLPKEEFGIGSSCFPVSWLEWWVYILQEFQRVLWHKNFGEIQTFQASQAKEAPVSLQRSGINWFARSPACACRLLYASRKLSVWEKKVVDASLDGLSFSCGSHTAEWSRPGPSRQPFVCYLFQRLALQLLPGWQCGRLQLRTQLWWHQIEQGSKGILYPQCEVCMDMDKTKSKALSSSAGLFGHGVKMQFGLL